MSEREMEMTMKMIEPTMDAIKKYIDGVSDDFERSEIPHLIVASKNDDIYVNFDGDELDAFAFILGAVFHMCDGKPENMKEFFLLAHKAIDRPKFKELVDRFYYLNEVNDEDENND